MSTCKWWGVFWRRGINSRGKRRNSTQAWRAGCSSDARDYARLKQTPTLSQKNKKLAIMQQQTIILLVAKKQNRKLGKHKQDTGGIYTLSTPAMAWRLVMSSHLDLMSVILSANPLAATIFLACSMIVEHSIPITWRFKEGGDLISVDR